MLQVKHKVVVAGSGVQRARFCFREFSPRDAGTGREKRARGHHAAGRMTGGAARAAKLTKEQRSEIAKKAAQGRWSKK